MGLMHGPNARPVAAALSAPNAPHSLADCTPLVLVIFFFPHPATAMAYKPYQRRRPDEALPGVTVGRFRSQSDGQVTGSPIVPVPASQSAGIRQPLSRLTVLSSHATSRPRHPFGRHLSFEVAMATGDDFPHLIASPLCRHLAKPRPLLFSSLIGGFCVANYRKAP